MRIILLLSCPDRRGIVAKVSQFIEQQGGNIVESMQYNATDTQTFFMRVEWDQEDSEGDSGAQMARKKSEINAELAAAMAEFRMNYELWIAEERARVAIMVSRHLHCLYDLLLQWRETEGREYDLVCVISNHPDARDICAWVGVPFHHIAVERDHKAEAEAQQLALLRQYNIDTVVLARYMQILSAEFVQRYPSQILNIHHSFLPAFVGSRPYHQAYERGVKVVGGTSHYVTADLDQGPIIEQDVQRISHSDTIEDITNIGKNLERTVLNRAVHLHLQRRVYVHGHKTIVFI